MGCGPEQRASNATSTPTCLALDLQVRILTWHRVRFELRKSASHAMCKTSWPPVHYGPFTLKLCVFTRALGSLDMIDVFAQRQSAMNFFEEKHSIFSYSNGNPRWKTDTFDSMSSAAVETILELTMSKVSPQRQFITENTLYQQLRTGLLPHLHSFVFVLLVCCWKRDLVGHTWIRSWFWWKWTNSHRLITATSFVILAKLAVSWMLSMQGGSRSVV